MNQPINQESPSSHSLCSCCCCCVLCPSQWSCPPVLVARLPRQYILSCSLSTLTMCDCFNFLSCPCPALSTYWASWKRQFLYIIDRIISYNGPFTDLDVQRITIERNLITYSHTGSHVCLTLHIDNPPRAPKKVSENGSSNTACLFTKPGLKGLNQDAMIVWEDFGCVEDAVLCGVFDGHGPYGHMVAQIVRDSLPSLLASNLESLKVSMPRNSLLESDKNMVVPLTDVEGHTTGTSLFSVWKESFLRSFLMTDRELRDKSKLDCFCSGTTALTLVKQGNDVIIGNVGDSRAILGTKSNDGSLVPVQLTIDLKPNLPQEAERIRQCKGRIFALHDEPEVHRVWLPHDNTPGLAMSRAFGDFCLKRFGIIAVPEVTHHQLTEKDQFIVLATDGIWDVLSNEEVVNIVSSTAKPLAARTVVETAIRAWQSRYPMSKVDDCAVVCLFMKGLCT